MRYTTSTELWIYVINVLFQGVSNDPDVEQYRAYHVG